MDKRDVKKYKNANAHFIIVNLKENYGKTFESVEEVEEFLRDDAEFINIDTDYIFEF